METFKFLKDFTEICSLWSNPWYGSIEHQAIIWTNDGKLTDTYMRHSASMG